MKTLKLHQEYTYLSSLSHEDVILFKNLLKGGLRKRLPIERSFTDLLIMPISYDSTLTCCGFMIEHHHIFRSEATNQLYLVFFPLSDFQIHNPMLCVYEMVGRHVKGFHLSSNQDNDCMSLLRKSSISRNYSLEYGDIVVS